jgi:hypothetical protein
LALFSTSSGRGTWKRRHRIPHLARVRGALANFSRLCDGLVSDLSGARSGRRRTGCLGGRPETAPNEYCQWLVHPISGVPGAYSRNLCELRQKPRPRKSEHSERSEQRNSCHASGVHEWVGTSRRATFGGTRPAVDVTGVRRSAPLSQRNSEGERRRGDYLPHLRAMSYARSALTVLRRGTHPVSRPRRLRSIVRVSSSRRIHRSADDRCTAHPNTW